MRMKLIGLMAATLLVAGCETPPVDDTSNAGNGNETVAPVADAPKMDAQEDLVLNVGDRVFFDFDKSSLRPDAIDQLNGQADWLKANNGITVVLEGHADERGTREYNLALSERRATSAKQYLRSMGIDRGRMEIIPYGKERPAVLGSNEEAWGQNRRAVMVVKSGSMS